MRSDHWTVLCHVSWWKRHWCMARRCHSKHAERTKQAYLLGTQLCYSPQLRWKQNNTTRLHWLNLHTVRGEGSGKADANTVWLCEAGVWRPTRRGGPKVTAYPSDAIRRRLRSRRPCQSREPLGVGSDPSTAERGRIHEVRGRLGGGSSCARAKALTCRPVRCIGVEFTQVTLWAVDYGGKICWNIPPTSRGISVTGPGRNLRPI